MTVLDVGCSFGIHTIWEQFGAALVAHGFDPMIQEIERLRGDNSNKNVHYHDVLVGLLDDHPFMKRRAQEEHLEAIGTAERGSLRALRALNPKIFGETPSASATYGWRNQELVRNKTPLARFVRSRAIDSVDFIKIDTDGADLEVLVSTQPILQSHEVLGIIIEASYSGSAASTANTLGNVDVRMRRQGFKLYDLAAARTSRKALPMPFANPWPGGTVSGPLAWGDFLYFRDPVDRAFSQHPVFTPSPMKLLKLACLFDIFGLADCAAELLLEHRDVFDGELTVDSLLDQLSPNGSETPYQQYVDDFYADSTHFDAT